MRATTVKLSLTGMAAAALLVAGACAGGNPCSRAPMLGRGDAMTTAEAATDPCAGQPVTHVVAWFQQGGSRYPLRCGHRDPAGYGYLHISADQPEAGAQPHGDPLKDPDFATEITTTLERGVEAHVGGGTWRYTLRYDATRAACTNTWGFRVVLAKSPPLTVDGHPTGIITALRYTSKPSLFP